MALANPADTGNGLILPTPMRIVAISWEKSNETPGSVVLMDESDKLIINISGVNGATSIESEEKFDYEIKLRALVTNGNKAFGSCRITLYFQPLGNFDFIGLNAIPFGGTGKPRFLLRLQGDVRTPLDNTGAYIGARFTVPSPMRLYRVGYQKRSSHVISLRVFKNGLALNQGTCVLSEPSGLSDFNLAANSQSRQLDAGDVILLICESSSASADCVVTLYTSQGTRTVF
jgi:hypothetical protein